MKMNHFAKLTLMAVASTFFFSQFAAAVPFSNGSFDDYAGPPANATQVDSATPSSWASIGSASQVLLRSTPAVSLSPQSGDYMVGIFGTSSTNGLYQTFDTVANTKYNVSFYLGRQTANGSPQVNIDVFDGSTTVGTGDLLDETTTINWTPGTWMEQVFSFTATSATSTIRFQEALGSPNVDPFLDTVSIQAVVPEPSSLVLTALGLVAVGFRRRRSR